MGLCSTCGKVAAAACGMRSKSLFEVLWVQEVVVPMLLTNQHQLDFCPHFILNPS
jgi:hypothetical protein